MRPPPNEQRAFRFALYSCHIPYAVHGLLGKRTETANLDMWDFPTSMLRCHEADVDLIIADGDHHYSDGVDAMDI